MLLLQHVTRLLACEWYGTRQHSAPPLPLRLPYLDLDELGLLRDVPGAPGHHLQHRVLEVLFLGLRQLRGLARQQAKGAQKQEQNDGDGAIRFQWLLYSLSTAVSSGTTKNEQTKSPNRGNGQTNKR